MAKKILLILGIFLVTLISILLLLPNYSSAIIQISNSDYSWTVTKSTGIESRLTFWTLNGKDKKTELGWIPPNNSCAGWTDQYLYDDIGNIIQDDKNKGIAIKCESAKCGGMNCYHISLTKAQAVNIDDYVRLGTGTVVVEYQEQKKVEYVTKWFNLSATLYIEINGDWNNTINNIFVYDNPDKKKFGANVSGFNETKKFKYIIESDKLIESYAVNKFKISNENETHVIDLTDICLSIPTEYAISLNGTDGEAIEYISQYWNPNCSFKLDKNKLEVEFLARYNSTLDMILVDPEMYIIPSTPWNGIIAYGGGSGLTTRIWNGTNFSLGFNPENVRTSGSQFVYLKSNHRRNETAMLVIDGNITIMISTNNTDWNQTLLALNFSSVGSPFAAIEYEDLSGDLVVFYEKNATVNRDIIAAAWNGTNWTSEVVLNTSASVGAGMKTVIVAKNIPGTDYIAVGTESTQTDELDVTIWNGSAQNNTFRVGTTLSTLEQVDFDIEVGNNSLVYISYGRTGGNNVSVYNWTSSMIVATMNINTTAGNIGGSQKLCADPNSDYIGFIGYDAGGDVTVRIINYTTPLDNYPYGDLTTENPPGYNRNVYCEFGLNGTALFMDAPVSNGAAIAWWVWTRQTNNWTCPQVDKQVTNISVQTPATGGTCQCLTCVADDPETIEIVRNPTGDEMMVTFNILSTAAVDIEAMIWNGTNLTNNMHLETAISSTDTHASSFTYNNFMGTTAETPTDEVYPIFYNYWDNNATVVNSGIGLFNVTVENTNLTVILEINGANYTPSYTENQCYQEFANVSTTCGGDSGGSYSGSAGSSAYDGNYATAASGNGIQLIATYKKKAGSTRNSILQLRDAAEIANYSLSSCWDYNDTYIIINASMNLAQTSVNWTCYTGSSWKQIKYSSYGPMSIYEETIIWNSSVYNVSATLSSGTYNYYWGSYGNGTNKNYNTSGLRNYVVNSSAAIDNFIVNITQSTSLTSGTGDRGTYTRQQRQGMTVNSTERNKGIFTRMINAIENIGSYLTRKITATRSILTYAAINSTSTIKGGYNRLVITYASINSNYTLKGMYNRISQLAIAINLKLLSPSQAAVTSYISNVYQSVSYNIYHTDRYTGRRIIFNGITINTNSDGVYNGRRQVLLSGTISTGADGVYSGRRMVTLTATIGDKIVKLISKNKNFYEVVTINTKNKFVSKITRAVLLPINIIASLRVVGTSVSDIVPPVLTVYSPTAKTYTTSIINLSVLATDDTAVDKYWFTLDEGKTNTTFTPNITLPNINFSVDATYSYTLSVFVNDTAGNIDYETILFYTGIDETNALYFIFYIAIMGMAFFLLILSYRDNNYIFGILAGMLISAIGVGIITIGYPGLSEGMVKKSLYLIFIGVGLVVLIYNSIKALGGDD